MTREVFIFDAIRTPRGAVGPTGPLAEVRPVELVAGLLSELVRRKDFDTAQVNDVVLGCNTQVGDQGANIGKISAAVAGWDALCGGSTVNRFCASGLDAIATAAAKIGVGYADMMVAGGVESMSRVPMFSDRGAWFSDPEVARTANFLHMGIAADVLATRHGITREDTDRYAHSSQTRAAAAWEAGFYDPAVVPVRDGSGAVRRTHLLLGGDVTFVLHSGILRLRNDHTPHLSPVQTHAAGERGYWEISKTSRKDRQGR